MDEPRVAAIVVNWNRRDDTLRCVESLLASTIDSLQVIVVDNASTDGSVVAIQDRFPEVDIVQNDHNSGFAEGNNLGIEIALERRCSHVLLLNNDAVVAPDAAQELLECFHDDGSVGVASGVVCYLSQPEVVWSAGGKIDWRSGEVTSDWIGSQVAQLPGCPWTADHVTGCCMLVSANAIRRAGALDPRFFMYYEETEWCARITKAGFRIVVEPFARIWHDIDPQAQLGSPSVAYYMTRNHLLFLSATQAPSSAWMITVFRQIRTVTALFVRPGSVSRMRGRVPMLRAMRDFGLGRFGPMQAVG